MTSVLSGGTLLDMSVFVCFCFIYLRYWTGKIFDLLHHSCVSVELLVHDGIKLERECWQSFLSGV